MKNNTLFEKIDMMEKYISRIGIDAVIPSLTSQKHYYLIKKIMHDESKYPKKELELESHKSKKREVLRSYYNNYFYDEYVQLVNGLCNKDMCFIAEAEYKLIAEGFSLDDGRYIIELDTIFANVSADIDEKKRIIIMSAELYNPYFGEENAAENYSALIEHTNDLFIEYCGETPCIHSSLEYCECEDESVSFELPVDSNRERIKEFITMLYSISSKTV